MTHVLKIIGLVLMITVSTGNIALADKAAKKKAKTTAAKKQKKSHGVDIKVPLSKAGEVKVDESKIPNAAWDQREFTATTVEERKLAHIRNRRAAKDAYDICVAKMMQSQRYYTTEERLLAIRIRCPVAPPENDFFPYEAIDVSCERGLDCGEEFDVTKKDLASFRAYFARKIKAVVKAAKLGLHMDVVEKYVRKEAKAPQRFLEFRLAQDCFGVYGTHKTPHKWPSSLPSSL